MTGGLIPYPAQKYLGWLGEVPEHWDVRRNKLFFREVDERSEYGSEDLLSVSQYTGVTLRRERPADGRGLLTNAASLVGYKHVLPGDLVMNIMLAWNGSLGVAPVEGIVSPAYCVFRATPGVEPRYLHYLLRTPLFTGVFKTVSTGVVDSRLRLYPDVFLRLPTLLPPLDEQLAIVRFLDHADRRIRRYIAAKKKLISLLNEQKQATIHKAVTGGLEPSIHPVPSGIEDLGEVPAHWAVSPLKRWVATKITDGPHETPDFVDNGIPFLSAESMTKGHLDFTRRRGFVSQDAHETYCKKLRPERDDIFMCKSGATTGKVAIVDVEDEFSVWSPLALIRADRRRVMPRLLWWVLQDQYVQRQVQEAWSYGTQPNLSMAAMERLLVVLPPVEEQAALVNHLEQTASRIVTAMDRAEGEIDLMREFRTRLIADVVTGRLDVREVAAHLSDEVVEPEPLDGIDALAEGDESEDEIDLGGVSGEVD